MSLNTTSRPASSVLTNPDLNVTLAAAFFGFSLSAILFGITIRQTYEYYLYTSARETKIRKIIIATIFALDLLNLVFGMNLLYNYIRELLGDSKAAPRVVWSLQVLCTTQVFLILLVHLYYLRQMWIFSSNSILLQKRSRIAAQIFVVTVAVFAIAVAVIFLSYLPRIDVVYGFTPGLEYIFYLALGTVAVVDCSIAAAMCVILYKCSSGFITGIASRSESVIESLIQYFVGTGLLTSFSAIMVIILYVARPHTLLYLVIEFSVTRLYANSILAMFNARHTLSDRMSQTIELNMPRNLSKEPESSGSRYGWHEQLATSPTSATRYSPAGESSRYTPGAGSHKQEGSGEEKPKISRDTARYTV